MFGACKYLRTLNTISKRNKRHLVTLRTEQSFVSTQISPNHIVSSYDCEIQENAERPGYRGESLLEYFNNHQNFFPGKRFHGMTLMVLPNNSKISNVYFENYKDFFCNFRNVQ